MVLERDAVVSALRRNRTIGLAARDLGASRRTLQNRMREYGLPRGQAGRPKHRLPYRHHGEGALIGGVALVALIGGALWWARKHGRPSYAAQLTSPTVTSNV